ncbi:hypothetical protein JYQ62_23800 [Nostoc sp. UHCC 0702]|nr:hypothetical protein JYQ62_23800 [Nostoc sp. UHCC 0702]
MKKNSNYANLLQRRFAIALFGVLQVSSRRSLLPFYAKMPWLCICAKNAIALVIIKLVQHGGNKPSIIVRN